MTMATRSFWRAALALALGLGLVMAPVAAERKSNSIRFVFLVDTSVAMTQHKAAISRAVAKSIQDGFGGQIQSGDLFALWTYDQTVATNRYLPVAWNPRQRERVASRLARALSDQVFQGEARVSEALPELSRLVAAEESLTAMIIHNGREIVSGDRLQRGGASPADRAASAEAASPQRIYVTTMQAQSGRVIQAVTKELADESKGRARVVEVTEPRARAASPLELGPASKAGARRPVANAKPGAGLKETAPSTAAELSQPVQGQDNPDLAAPAAVASSAKVAESAPSSAQPDAPAIPAAAQQPVGALESPSPEPALRGELPVPVPTPSLPTATAAPEVSAPPPLTTGPTVNTNGTARPIEPAAPNPVVPVSHPGAAASSVAPSQASPASPVPPPSEASASSTSEPTVTSKAPDAVVPRVSSRPAADVAGTPPPVDPKPAVKTGRSAYLRLGLVLLVVGVGLFWWRQTRTVGDETSLISRSIGSVPRSGGDRSVRCEEPAGTVN